MIIYSKSDYKKVKLDSRNAVEAFNGIKPSLIKKSVKTDEKLKVWKKLRSFLLNPATDLTYLIRWRICKIASGRMVQLKRYWILAKQRRVRSRMGGGGRRREFSLLLVGGGGGGRVNRKDPFISFQWFILSVIQKCSAKLKEGKITQALVVHSTRCPQGLLLNFKKSTFHQVFSFVTQHF